MSYTGMAYRLPRPLRRHILYFEGQIEDAVAAFARALPAEARVLDAGSGEGQYRLHFARQLYTGVDLAVGDAAWDYSQVDALADLTALPFRAASKVGAGRHPVDRGAARMGSPPGAARLFPLYALQIGRAHV